MRQKIILFFLFNHKLASAILECNDNDKSLYFSMYKLNRKIFFSAILYNASDLLGKYIHRHCVLISNSN